MTGALPKFAAFARARLGRFRDDESGATVIEYGLIICLIFLAIVGAIHGYVNSTSAMYSKIDDAIENP